jgi:YbbR domain-containing protein
MGFPDKILAWLRPLLAGLTHAWPAKVLSIAAAIIIFVFHRMSVLEERYFSSPLIVETSGNLTPASAYTRMVRVSLRGDMDSINSVLEDDIETYLDLSAYSTSGVYKAPVQIMRHGTALVARSLEITVSPIEVSITLDEKTSRYIPVSPIIEGSPASGYEFASYTLNPTRVQVEGPRSVVSQLDDLSTDVINLEGRSENWTQNVSIQNRDPLVIIQGDGITEFKGNIRRIVALRTLNNQSIGIEGLQSDFSASLSPGLATIRVEGAQNDLSAWRPDANTVYVDASEITAPGTYNLHVQARLPGAFSLSRIDPSSVTISVQSNSIQSNSVQSNNIQTNDEHTAGIDSNGE